jgi:Ser/Thr protein kinase RdoA (MazF antagonist)
VSGQEVVLAGSRLNRVVRVGDTVHRPAGAWTPTVHALLRHLRGRGFTLGPQPLGFDEQGREVLSYVPGEAVGDSLPWPDWVWPEDLLAAVGRATAGYHDAVADFRPAGPISWHAGARPLGPDEIVCHHDIAPYNVVVEAGQLRGIIDWDLVGPGTRRSELAFVAWQWVPLQHPSITRLFGWRTEPDLGRRLRILLDSYGLTDRSGFIDDVLARIQRNRDLMLRKCHEGDAAYIRLQEEGHVIGMNMAIEFVGDQRERLQAELD